LAKERRFPRVFAFRADPATADFISKQADPAEFIRRAVKDEIINSHADTTTADGNVMVWGQELERLERELEEANAAHNETGRKLTRLAYSSPPASEEDQDVARRVYDAQTGRIFDLETRIKELKKKILEV
jgi:hypothetical protein